MAYSGISYVSHSFFPHHLVIMNREYDISMDPEEPQQTLSFMPERLRASSIRGDSSSREVVSFCLGKGKADWGPLTVYALAKNGDIWAMCPFMPSNACVSIFLLS